MATGRTTKTDSGKDDFKVMRAVDDLRNELVKLTQNLTRIKSPTGEEKEIQAFVKSKFLENGFEVRAYSRDPKRPNVVASLRGNQHRPNMLFVAHVDNIPSGDPKLWRFPPFEGRVVGKRIFGRGVADMKAGLAAMIIAAKAIRQSAIPLEGSLSIASVVDEERDGLNGMQFLINSGVIRADAALFGEPSFPCIDIALKGCVSLKVTTYGKAVGSGWPQDGVNAVTNLARILVGLDKLDLNARDHPLLGRSTIAPGTMISGGTTIHSIPDQCQATVDVHFVPGYTPDEVYIRVKNYVERLQSKLNSKAKVEMVFAAEPYEIRPDEKVLRDLQRSVKSVFGTEANMTGVPSFGDARFFGKLGIPAIPAYGPGEKGKGHVVNESVHIDTLLNVTKVYALFALRTCAS